MMQGALTLQFIVMLRTRVVIRLTGVEHVIDDAGDLVRRGANHQHIRNGNLLVAKRSMHLRVKEGHFLLYYLE